MNKNEILRVNSGTLTNESGTELPIDFGLIYQDNGLVTCEFYISEVFNLENAADDTPLMSEYFDGLFRTEDRHSLEIRSLVFDAIEFTKHKVSMTCLDCFILTKIREDLSSPEDNEKGHKLHYLELEGVRMEYCTASQHSRIINGEEQNHYKVSWDYTSTGLVADGYIYNQVFTKSTENDNVIVTFPHDTNNKLLYSTFLDFKRDYLSLFSFINGATVKVRKECTGSYYSGNKVDSEVVIIYSFDTIKNANYNKYIPLNDHTNRSSNILNRVFCLKFDKFREWNKKIDLATVIFFLNGVEMTDRLHERFFIQIIAFERLSALYAEMEGPAEIYYPTPTDFQPIKNKLIELLEEHKGEFGDYFGRAKSIVSNLNQVKRASTRDKMEGILMATKIPINDDVDNLINVVRHSAIHKGDIGDDNSDIKNMVLLNELLYEIILRLIEYDGPRSRKILITA